MRTEKEIYDLVLNFAFQDERIRIVTLEGSRTNVNIPKDNLQDYDITFFVIDMGEFLKSDDWLSVFGNRIMLICVYVCSKKYLKKWQIHLVIIILIMMKTLQNIWKHKREFQINIFMVIGIDKFQFVELTLN